MRGACEPAMRLQFLTIQCPPTCLPFFLGIGSSSSISSDSGVETFWNLTDFAV
jgi:hypothetical protein